VVERFIMLLEEGATVNRPSISRLLLATVLALFAAVPAAAEGLIWDFGIYSALDAEMSAGENARIYSAKDPNIRRTRFVLQGTGEEDWTEMFEVLNTQPRNEPKTAKLWYERLKTSADADCPSEWLVVEEVKSSMTVERRIPECAPLPARTILYRVMYGKQNVFALSANVVGDVSEDMRKSWLAVLASAKIMR